MTIAEISKKAEELARQFNPDGLAPFPYEHITAAYKNLDIVFSADLDGDVAGAILYKDEQFTILVNANKPQVRQSFTIAHELGHFFLHQDEIKAQKAIIDSDEKMGDNFERYTDDIDKRKLEVEANDFAASLIMPEWLLREAWGVSNGIEDAAQLFQVSPVAMSLRLNQLRLVL